MITTIMIYCISIAALVSAAAFVIERAFAQLGWARRTVWILALIASLSLPMLLIGMQDTQTFTPVAASPIDVSTVTEHVATTELTQVPLLTRYAGPLDSALKILWPVASLGFVLFAFIGWLRLRRASRSWRKQVVDDVHVRVTEDLGPAVVGFLHPEIVIPQWLLGAAAADRIAAIQHERSHIAAGDPKLLMSALVLVALMPWNLPMWWQLRRLRFAIEVDCDRRVLNNGTSIESYGEMLLAVGLRSCGTAPLGAIALIEPVSQLEQRIRIMTTGKYRYATLLVSASLAMSVSLVAVATQLKAPSLPAIAPEAAVTKIAVDQPLVGNSGSVSVAAKSDVVAPLKMQIEKTNKVATAPAKPTKSSTAKSSQTLIEKKPSLVSTPLAPESRVMLAGSPVAKDTAVTASDTSTPDRKIKRFSVERPIYPEAALRDNVQGWVEIGFTVNASGAVEDAQVRDANPKNVFDDAALTAVRQWRYEPAIKDGKAIAATTVIRLKFTPPGLTYDPRDGSDQAATQVESKSTPVAAKSSDEKLNLKFIDVDVRAVLKVLSDAGGKNILISDRVSGKISIQLSDTPWQQALEMICKQAGLQQRLSGNVIMIEPK